MLYKSRQLLYIAKINNHFISMSDDDFTLHELSRYITFDSLSVYVEIPIRMGRECVAQVAEALRRHGSTSVDCYEPIMRSNGFEFFSVIAKGDIASLKMKMVEAGVNFPGSDQVPGRSIQR